MSYGDPSSSLRPLRRLGQNFLIDKAVRDLLLGSADLDRSDIVLEVGAGRGFLTEALVDRVGKVIAIEKDPRLVSLLRQKYRGSRRLRIIEGDILKTKLPRFNKVVSTPPYYISSRLILLLISKRFRCAALTLQKEFAQRLAARPCSPDYGRISVMVQHRCSVELAGLISRTSFRPVPEVDSAVVVMHNKKAQVPVKSERMFSDMVRFMFTQRKRKANKVLRSYLESIGRGEFRPQVGALLRDERVFQLTVSDFERLSNEVFKMRSAKHD